MIPKLSQLLSLGNRHLVSASGEGKAPEVFPLEKGQLLEGRVLEMGSKGQYVVETELGRLNIESKALLSKGQQVQLQVLTTRPETTLKLLETPLKGEMRPMLGQAGVPVDPAPLVRTMQNTILVPVSPSMGASLTSISVTAQSSSGAKGAAAGEIVNGMSSRPVRNAATSPSTSVITTQTSTGSSTVLGSGGQFLGLQSLTPERLAQMNLPLLEATIVALPSKDQAVINIENSSYHVQGRIEGSLGEQRQLQLISLLPQLQLSVLSKEGGGQPAGGDSQSSNLLTSLEKAPDLSPLLKGLNIPFVTGMDSLGSRYRNTLLSFSTLTPERLSGKDAGAILKHGLEQLRIRNEIMPSKGGRGLQ